MQEVRQAICSTRAHAERKERKLIHTVTYGGKRFLDYNGSHAKPVRTLQVESSYVKRPLSGSLYTFLGLVGLHDAVQVAHQFRHTPRNVVAKYVWHQRRITRRRTAAGGFQQSQGRVVASMVFTDLSRS